MNRVLNINLGGYAFTIDEDAYQYLENYLSALNKHFRASQGHEEIIGDIESRLAELFRESMGGRTILDIRNVKNAISVMGRPEDFGAEPITDKKSSSTGSSFGQTPSTGKRLFRDPDNKVVGGVCSGLADYLGISDPLWVRLFFVVLMFGFGTGFLLYIALMILIPKAKTTADRLAMKGEPVTVDSIAKSVEEGVNNLKDTIADFSAKTEQSFKDGTAKRNFEGATSRVGDLIAAFIRGIGHLARPLIIIVGFCIIFGFLISWIISAIGIAIAYPFLNFISPWSTASSWLGMTNLFFIFLIPALALIFLLRRILTGKHTDPLWKAGMWVFFTVNVISASILGINFGRQWSHRTEITDNIPMNNTTSDRLTLLLTDRGDEGEEIHFKIFDVDMDGDQIFSRNTRFNVVKSPDGQFSLSRKVFANGISTAEAKRLVSEIEYKPTFSGDTLSFSKKFSIPKDSKWRNQRVVLTLSVPVGKKITVASRDEDWFNMDFVEDAKCGDGSVYTYIMTSDGLKCVK